MVWTGWWTNQGWRVTEWCIYRKSDLVFVSSSTNLPVKTKAVAWIDLNIHHTVCCLVLPYVVVSLERQLSVVKNTAKKLGLVNLQNIKCGCFQEWWMAGRILTWKKWFYDHNGGVKWEIVYQYNTLLWSVVVFFGDKMFLLLCCQQGKNSMVAILKSLWTFSEHSSINCLSGPEREAGDVWCLPPVWNLRAVIWFHFPIYLLTCFSS